MNHPMKRNRKKLKARAQRWAALKEAILIEEGGIALLRFMRGTDKRQPVGMLGK